MGEDRPFLVLARTMCWELFLKPLYFTGWEESDGSFSYRLIHLGLILWLFLVLEDLTMLRKDGG